MVEKGTQKRRQAPFLQEGRIFVQIHSFEIFLCKAEEKLLLRAKLGAFFPIDPLSQFAGGRFNGDIAESGIFISAGVSGAERNSLPIGNGAAAQHIGTFEGVLHMNSGLLQKRRSDLMQGLIRCGQDEVFFSAGPKINGFFQGQRMVRMDHEDGPVIIKKEAGIQLAAVKVSVFRNEKPVFLAETGVQL